MTSSSWGLYNCYKCPIPIAYHSDQIEPEEITYIQFFIDDYMIELDADHAKCRLYQKPKSDSDAAGYKYMFRLNCYPDITPKNVNYWLDRLLNIMIFS